MPFDVVTRRVLKYLKKRVAMMAAEVWQFGCQGNFPPYKTSLYRARSLDGRFTIMKDFSGGVGIMKRVEARAPWVGKWGYSRAVRKGALIEVGGTTAGNADGTVEGGDDLYAQTKYALSVVVLAIEELGGSVSDVLRTRVFLRDIEHWEAAGRAHLEIFGELLPTSTCVGGVAMLNPAMLVEIEATAMVSDPGRSD
jgi:enamine deaminase RidA (YjgF/YER057c/UK114 family)